MSTTQDDIIKPCECGSTTPPEVDMAHYTREVQVYCPGCYRQTHYAGRADVIYDWNNDDAFIPDYV